MPHTMYAFMHVAFHEINPYTMDAVMRHFEEKSNSISMQDFMK